MGKFYSNGKLLLTGEYAVLDGALSLALPTLYGQFLYVTDTNSGKLYWESVDDKGNVWFKGTYQIDSLQEISASDTQISQTLIKILTEARRLNASFLNRSLGCEVKTKLTFPKDWGLGSSSTLINNIAQWAQIDAYRLLWNAFSGSGYDIACAQHNHPITYALNTPRPMVKRANFDPPFKDRLFFVHLNKKQNSREGIAQYRHRAFDKEELIRKISGITAKISSCTQLAPFESLLMEHETALSEILHVPTIKTLLFSDYQGGAVKSLGAWGGDFILATGNEKTPEYFKSRGYKTVIPYLEMILTNSPF